MVSLAPLLLKTAGWWICIRPVADDVTSLLCCTSLCVAKGAGYRARALDGTTSAYDETTANQRFSSPNILKLYTTNNCPDYIGQYSLTVA
ncbi:hypothetical protein KOSB73_220686 [Klebsiella grimontii]|uniref:Uncharacterized protein n=1 Tax=Klebsiella grimontii TaxID=2058152 RepID=A0A285B0X8_9ENTR|nr:hypothetical protein KOSB73_220686 [Klebsiella grimontii]